MTSYPVSLRFGRSAPKRFAQAALLAISAIGASVHYSHAASTVSTASTSVITGIVTNKTTGNGLIGARVEIPALNISTLVDNTGRYLLNRT
jgi:hypothetical protein